MTADLSARIQQHVFPDSTTLASALAASVADDLRTALQQRAFASVALSGGNTPKAFRLALPSGIRLSASAA